MAVETFQSLLLLIFLIFTGLLDFSLSFFEKFAQLVGVLLVWVKL
jgi:hypothetical protein